MLPFHIVDVVELLRDLVLLALNRLLVVLHLDRLQFELLLQLLEVSLLLLDYRVALDNLLFALFQLLFHLGDLALIDRVRVSELGTLLLQRSH